MPLLGRSPLSNRSLNVIVAPYGKNLYNGDDNSAFESQNQAYDHVHSRIDQICPRTEQPPLQASKSILDHPLFALLFADTTPSPIDHSHHFERVAKLRELPDYARLLKNEAYINDTLSSQLESKHNHTILQHQLNLYRPYLTPDQLEMINYTLQTLHSVQRTFLHYHARLDTLRFYIQFLTALFQRTPDGEPHHDRDFLAHPLLNDMFFYLDLQANSPADSPKSLFVHYQTIIARAKLALDRSTQDLTRLSSSPDYLNTLSLLTNTQPRIHEQQTHRTAAGIIARRVHLHAAATAKTRRPHTSRTAARLASTNCANIHQTGMTGHIPLSHEIIAALAKVQECHLRAIDAGIAEQERQCERLIEKEEERRRGYRADELGLFGVERRLFLEAEREARRRQEDDGEKKKKMMIKGDRGVVNNNVTDGGGDDDDDDDDDDDGVLLHQDYTAIYTDGTSYIG